MFICYRKQTKSFCEIEYPFIKSETDCVYLFPGIFIVLFNNIGSIWLSYLYLLQTCQDTPGSFTCSISCNSGYEESVSGVVTSCVDVDECSLALCDSVTEDCNNTVGKPTPTSLTGRIK